MDTTEVTQADYLTLMGVNPSYFTGFTGDSLRPVEEVTWYDAVLYCNKRSKRDGRDTVYSYTSVTGTPGNGCEALDGLAIDFAKNGYRLPTEAEWEYACRAGTTTDYYWNKNYPPITTSDSAAIYENAIWYDNAFDETAQVATQKANAWGLYDMAGNVWEWCNDNWSNSYTSGSQTDPTGPATGNFRVLRGGSFEKSDYYLQSASRRDGAPFEAGGGHVAGFRCVRR
jgi:formylglycine-generating enzyme required for sulfatase activity